MKVTDLVFGLIASQQKECYTFDDLCYLAAPFAVSPATLRTNLARMVSAQTLSVHRIGRKALYSFGDRGLRIKANILHGFTALDWKDWDRTYWGVVFSVPEAHGENRHAIRRKLAKYRFACLNPGLWVRPLHPAESIPETFGSMLASGYCRLIRFTNHAEFSPEQMSFMWNLQDINRAFAQGISMMEQSTRKLYILTPSMALVEKMTVGDTLVKTISRDPMLPPEFLPPDWKGYEIRHKFTQFDQMATQYSKPYCKSIEREEDAP